VFVLYADFIAAVAPEDYRPDVDEPDLSAPGSLSLVSFVAEQLGAFLP